MAKEEKMFTGEKKPDEKLKVAARNVKKISIMFRHNRKFDLHIGREMLTFRGRESKQVPESWLKHRDWQNVAKYFIAKGV